MDDGLISWLASTAKDPLAFVHGAFPWGEAGSILEKEQGPEPWQTEILEWIRDGLIDLQQALRIAVASGHGIGKTALVSWIILWGVSTCVDTRGIVTANTEPQLKTKTWAELAKWYHLFLGKDNFKLTATALFSVDEAHERQWRIDMMPWSKDRPEAFAGLHNKGRRIIIIFDEGSGIDDIIYETIEGALTDADTEIIWCVFGNPTRNSGRFRECFAGQRFAELWRSKQVDSREVSFTNKLDIKTKIEVYGEDSDYVRIRILGVFPRVGEMEFFSISDIEAAMLREAECQTNDPLTLGVDVARFGQNASVIFPRKGRDARTIPRERYQGVDTVSLAQSVFALAQRLRADGTFVDGGGVGGGVVDNLRHMRWHCFDIQFGGKPSYNLAEVGAQGEKYANKRAEMYGALRAWLRTGAIPNDPELKQQLTSITYTFNKRDEIILTSKEEMMRDGKPSPDDIDGLALTFALPIAKSSWAGGEHPEKPLVEWEYNPYETERVFA